MNQIAAAPLPVTEPATLERWLTGPRFAALPARTAALPAPALSFEFFPPKTDSLEAQLWTCVRRL
ncbi:MAG: methylenetetrahydrofolate reductase [NAD(P)H], partial [Gemmatimonadaceae bacterium]|nr:methylenetetrahydrofolate reductase [NAD(P)H] [Acetobacteraceae bacterium]